MFEMRWDNKNLKTKALQCSVYKKIEKPVLTKDDIPYEASLIFNAGVAKYKGKYVTLSSGRLINTAASSSAS